MTGARLMLAVGVACLLLYLADWIIASAGSNPSLLGFMVAALALARILWHDDQPTTPGPDAEEQRLDRLEADMRRYAHQQLGTPLDEVDWPSLEASLHRISHPDQRHTIDVRVLSHGAMIDRAQAKRQQHQQRQAAARTTTAPARRTTEQNLTLGQRMRLMPDPPDDGWTVCSHCAGTFPTADQAPDDPAYLPRCARCHPTT